MWCARWRTTRGWIRGCSRRSLTSHAAEPSGRMRLSELQELMHPRYSQPGLSRLVQRMEADGLLERRADPRGRPGHHPGDHARRSGAVRPSRRGLHGCGPSALRAASPGCGGPNPRALARDGSPSTRATSVSPVAYRSASMIKYIGSKRRLVPVLGDLASAVGCADCASTSSPAPPGLRRSSNAAPCS